VEEGYYRVKSRVETSTADVRLLQADTMRWLCQRKHVGAPIDADDQITLLRESARVRAEAATQF
jgi:hypothetical protein